MVLFWTIAVAMMAIALAFLLMPLLRKPVQLAANSREQLNIEIFKDQVRELESDLRIGQLNKDQFELAKSDLERSLLENVGDYAPVENTGSDVINAVIGKASAWVIILAVPLVSVLLYMTLGGGKDAFNPQVAQPQVAAEGHNGAQVEQMVDALKARLAENPNDSEGWAMLGRSYYFLQRYPESNQAYAKAVELTADKPNPDYLADFADTLALINNRSLAGKPTEAVMWALKINPDHPKSLWLAGTAALEAQDYQAAKAYWTRLYALLPPNSQNAQMVQANLDEVNQVLGGDASSPANTDAAANPAKVSGKVQLSEALRAKTSPEDVVFIFARAAEGPRMPLAIIRKQVKDLPIEFSLDDSMAMNPAMKLSSFPQVIVGARVSKSGTAMPQAGDLEGHSAAVSSVGTQGITIEIDSVVGQ